MSRIAPLLLVVVALTTSVSAQEKKDPSDAHVADRCRELLNTSLVDFYLPASVDAVHGGYLEVLDDQGQFTGSEKFLTLQARQVWFFSTLAVAGIRRNEALAAAQSGYDFLRRHFYDQVNGGYFAKTTREGVPTDRRKHVYLNAFVIYAFVEYARATGQSEPLKHAVQLFRTLDKHCYDRQYGGYNEFFSDDWQLVTDPKAHGYVGAIGTKTYNSHLHLMEAFTALYRETQDAIVRARLSELVQINSLTVKHPQLPCNIDGWHPDWTIVATPRNMRASYGHDVECAWLVLDAADALGQPTATLRNWATAICDYAIKYGRDSSHGGFFYTGPLDGPSDDRKKEWWTQSEVLVAMLVMHRLTGEKKYRDIFDETFAFITKHQVSPQGSWWSTVGEDGSLGSNRNRTTMWQGAYHNGRALLLCEQLLREQTK